MKSVLAHTSSPLRSKTALALAHQMFLDSSVDRERGEGALLVKEAARGGSESPESSLAISSQRRMLLCGGGAQQDGLIRVAASAVGPKSQRLPANRAASAQQGPECVQSLGEWPREVLVT